MAKVQYEEQLINAVIGYLGKKPYEEVFQLIGALQQTATIVEDKVEEPKKEEALPEEH